MSSFCRRSGWTFVGTALLLHLPTVFAFSRQPARLAAFTVIPIWFWGGIGLGLTSLAFCFLRAPPSLVLSTVWGTTFQRRVPILRIDHLYTPPQLTPVRAKAHTTQNSDHRMVIADYLFPN